MIRFKSVCLIAVNEVYIIPKIDNVKIKGLKKKEASGNNGNENLKNPYVPSFNKIPAKSTDPAVGAST